MIGGHGEDQGVGLADIQGVYVRTGFHQRLDGFVIALARSHLQGGQVAQRDGAVLDHFGRLAAFVVYRGAELDQQFDYGRIAVAVAGSAHQRGEAAAVRGIHGGAFG